MCFSVAMVLVVFLPFTIDKDCTRVIRDETPED
jgi:hypothetical protein